MIVVDDGMATGAVAALAGDFDAVVCLEPPRPLYGVGAFHRDFHRLSDDEAVSLLQAHHAGAHG